MFLQNEIIFSHLIILMANLSLITLIKLLLFLTLLVAFYSSMHNLLLSCIIYFDFILDVLIVVNIPRVHLVEVKIHLFFKSLSTFQRSWTGIS